MIVFLLVVSRAIRAFFYGFKDPEYRTLAIAMLLLLAGGTLFYHRFENWSWLDSLYFCVVALLTVGFGDLVPTTDLTKIFTIAYLLMGVGLIATYIQVIIRKKLDKPQDKGH